VPEWDGSLWALAYIGAAADRLNGRPLLRRFALYIRTSSGRSNQSRPAFRASSRPARIAWRTELGATPRIAAASATVSICVLDMGTSGTRALMFPPYHTSNEMVGEASFHSTRMRVL